jgi:hypothetical protein
MRPWIYLSKDGQDEYINGMAKADNSPIVSTDDFIFEDSSAPIALRGILKHKIMKRCWDEGRDFFYVDTGYFGNERTPANPNGWKYWHRIVRNNLQHGEIVQRPADRWEQFGKKFEPWKKDGRKILIAKPDEKPCKFYGIDLEQWTAETIETIKKYTDRPVEVRDRAAKRIDRTVGNTLKQALDDDVFALVTYNSNAATEAVMYGIPTFTLAPCNAASPVTSQDISQIENPYYPDHDKLFAWACHLAYGQFHNKELFSGKAKEMLEEGIL